MACLLIRYGSDVNSKDINGRGPLYFAAINGHRELVDILIGNMASCFTVDNNGDSITSVVLEPLIKSRLQKGKMVSSPSIIL
jgi:ankyrin repeat protein